MKIILIMSGCSGIGKSTYANKVSELATKDGKTVGICSADHFFMDSFGNYNFDRNELSAAHTFCKNNCELLCALGTNIVICDNTNLVYKEIAPYCSIAERYGYNVAITRLESGLSDEELESRNTHGVPIEAIVRMRAKMEPMDKITAKIYEIYGPKLLVESHYYKEEKE